MQALHRPPPGPPPLPPLGRFPPHGIFGLYTKPGKAAGTKLFLTHQGSIRGTRSVLRLITTKQPCKVGRNKAHFRVRTRGSGCGRFLAAGWAARPSPRQPLPLPPSFLPVSSVRGSRGDPINADVGFHTQNRLVLHLGTRRRYRHLDPQSVKETGAMEGGKEANNRARFRPPSWLGEKELKGKRRRLCHWGGHLGFWHVLTQPNSAGLLRRHLGFWKRVRLSALPDEPKQGAIFASGRDCCVFRWLCRHSADGRVEAKVAMLGLGTRGKQQRARSFYFRKPRFSIWTNPLPLGGEAGHEDNQPYPPAPLVLYCLFVCSFNYL